MSKKKTMSVRRLVTAGVIGGLYAALTLLLTPLSFAGLQCRLSEALTVLAAFTPAAIPGLIVGCLVSNLAGLTMGANPAGALDLLLGPLATGLAAVWSYCLRNRKWGGVPLLSTLPPVILNALIVGAELALVAPEFSVPVLFIQMGSVGLGELLACVAGGGILAAALCRTGVVQKLFTD